MPEKPGEKFGDLLVKSRLIDAMQLQAALGHQRRWGGKLGQCLIDLGFITELELLSFMSDKFKIPAIDLAKSKISPQAFASVPEMVAKKYGVVPIFLKEGPGKKKTLTLAMSDPTNLKVLDEVQFLTGFKVEPVLAVESTISKVLEHYGHITPGDLEEKLRPDIARPLDLREPPPPSPEADSPKTPKGQEVAVVLGGEEPTDDMEEILDIEEAEQEGVEISADEDVKVIRDEVVMVKAEAPKAKPKIGSSTERVPTRAPIREKVSKIPEMESYQPKIQQPEPKPEIKEPESEISFLKVPEISLTPPDLLEVQQEPAAKVEREIEIGIPETDADEKMELSPAHEFLSWEDGQAQKTPKIPMQNIEEPEPSPAVPIKKTGEFAEAKSEREPVSEQELTKLVKPESAEDDFWTEQDHLVIKPKVAEAADDEESPPFERALAAPPKPAVPVRPEKKDMEFLDEYSDENARNSGQPAQLRQKPVAVEQSPEFHKPVPAIQDLNSDQSGEMSLEFAFKKINELEVEVKRREFHFDELLSLMMKKELGEITTELFMHELAILKAEMEKKQGNK